MTITGTTARLPAEPRIRLLLALILAFATASITQLSTLPLAVLAALILATLSGQTRTVLVRLRWAALLGAAILVSLTLFSGTETLWQAGPLRLRRDGLETGMLIAARLLAIVSMTLALLGSLPPPQLAQACRGIGLPGLISDLMMLTLRYIDDMRQELGRVELARRLRGGRPGWQALGSRGMIMATALVRSQYRADRVWAAMRLRGHERAQHRGQTAPTRTDILWIAAALAVAVLIIVQDRF